jgi:hypothetical protein
VWDAPARRLAFQGESCRVAAGKAPSQTFTDMLDIGVGKVYFNGNGHATPTSAVPSSMRALSTALLGRSGRRLTNKPLLTPGFVDNQRHRVGQIDTAASRAHGNGQGIVQPYLGQHGLRQSACFGTE